MNILKYIFFLVVLFFLGLGLLGMFNPGFEIEVEEEVIASVGKTWDTFSDTSTWDDWRTGWKEWQWENGLRVEEGTVYSWLSVDDQSFKSTIKEWHTDSLMVIESISQNGDHCLATLRYKLENGKTIITQKQEWKASNFKRNVGLNFKRASLEKTMEKDLEALKKLIHND